MDNKPPILLGIIIDVSNSMERNRKNKDGRIITRLEGVRQTLDTQFKKANIARRKNLDETHVFCLGMGFKRKMYWSSVDLSYEQERKKREEVDEKTDAQVVCDLLALGEIIPSKGQLHSLKQAVRQQWEAEAQQLIKEYTDIDEGVYQELEDFIRLQIQNSATKRIDLQIVRKIRSFLADISVFENHGLLQNIVEYINNRLKAIKDTSLRASQRHVSEVLGESKVVFEQDREKYEEIVESHVAGFVDDLVRKLVWFLTLGFPLEEIVNHFDSTSEISGLSKRIYSDLENEVEKIIRIPWLINKGNLLVSSKSVCASVNTKQVRILTEKCVQKIVWELLRDFVTELIVTIFSAKFEERAKEQIPHWLGLASSREVTRTLSEIAQVFPDSIDEIELYSNEFMFGCTPIEQALRLATLRFHDQSRTDHEKLLVIISDGEFDTKMPIHIANLLKNSGVTIVCCCMADRDFMTKLRSIRGKTWPDGAKNMFEMASVADENNKATQNLIKYVELDDIKLFYQINQSEVLEKVFEGLINSA